ncbi:hypothetical protein BZG13_12895 [Salinivibrio sp. ML323]|uniref:DUF726 domain-containing protein n=1 Tax=Salinivibrio sp. ML323 TaxID=1909474 RepID=UPI0009C54FAA|nr:DUF726 domain-containing protein [Salinivibrio sp. ML323]OOE56938.1 hypothetical protein BZG13_12895 [Salinivibrio sp. ML323]
MIVINGFLSESEEDIKDWLSVVDELYPFQRVLHLDWPSGNLKKLFGFSNDSTIAFEMLSSSVPILRAGSAVPAFIANIANIGTDWSKAIRRSEDAGIWLAHYINNQESNQFILMGHSLGASVSFNALSNLERKNSIHSIYLFGGAMSNTEKWIETCTRHPGSMITNCYSTNDWVLKFLYKIGTLFSNIPIGLKPIPKNANNLIYNVDLSNIVNGHTSYKKKEVGICIKERVELTKNNGHEIIDCFDISLFSIFKKVLSEVIR